jgi:hypothetical protein
MILNHCKKKNLPLTGRCDFKTENIRVKFKKIILELIIVNLHGFTPVVSSRLNSRVQAALAPNLLAPAARYISL